MNLLDTYVRGWRESADAVLSLAPSLDETDWSTPTDCPGWTVKDVLAHLAHLETELCSIAQNTHDVTGAHELVSSYTEAGVAERRHRTPTELIDELTAAVELRSSRLVDVPDDPATPAPVTPGGISWTWDKLLRNRSLDMWVHEQDIRRAIGRPGGLDSTGAQIATMTFSLAMPFILGKKVRPPASSIVHWDVTGAVPLDLAVQIGDDGRASPVNLVGQPTTTLSMDSETFTALAAGRRTSDMVDVTITGDHALGLATLAAMSVTP
ncbi:maleylpyruvate isomerase family mycothiol-dependent enzyme [Aeromicrobium sp.]|uniref:maleylpyruvate isomerase family mycothiol-dependent enzyme n=1 Tax=Aeromicrobium sp. TaxID=1871063 RepID=UPI0019BD0A30|nr:maleylpyruvate isomerase family mycothiol-dependent enzyme [Aeromicrobium sp.]MBC7631957.1 maleylpyruvate isomerase family mycothiol-dependent enzyme [Aeromicrobium sp.]